MDEFLALRKEIRHMLKHDISTTDTDSEAPPGETDNQDSAVIIVFLRPIKSCSELEINIIKLSNNLTYMLLI